MSNNKQSSSIDFLKIQFEKHLNWKCNPVRDENCFDELQLMDSFEQAKAKYEHEMCVFADEYASYVLEQSKSGIKGAMVSMCAWTFFKNRRNEQQ